MDDWFKGEQVKAYLLVGTKTDNVYGSDGAEYEPVEVNNVLVAPTATTDIEGNQRLAGDSTTLSFYLPKEFTESLRGALIELDGRRYEIQGDPVPYPSDLTPGEWDRVATGILVEG